MTVAYRATIKSRNQKYHQAAESKIKAPGPDRAYLLSKTTTEMDPQTAKNREHTEKDKEATM